MNLGKGAKKNFLGFKSFINLRLESLGTEIMAKSNLKL